METVEIPATIMVSAVLKKLQLPCPKCKSHTVPVGVVLIVFFTLQHSHGPSDQIQGAKRIRYKVLKDSATPRWKRRKGK
jgi:hypothetical protein